MSKLILDIEKDEMNLFKKQYISLPELSDEIDELIENKPKSRKKKELQDWKDKVNFLIDMYNVKSKHKNYNKIK